MAETGVPSAWLAPHVEAIADPLAMIVDTVRTVLHDTGLDASRLILEVTEADIIYDTDPIIECLNALRALGVRIALDDFGTGHSSLSRLRDFPVDVLKIDRSFTASLCGPTQSIGFAHSVFSFGVGLGLSVIAEGVETEECLHELQDLGCELAQGYLFGQPLTPFAMRRLLERSVAVPISPMSLAAAGTTMRGH